MSEPLMGYDEAAAWLGVPRKWLEHQVQQKKVPHTRLGKHVRFSEAHLQDIVKAGEPKLSVASVQTDPSMRPVSSRGRRSARA